MFTALSLRSIETNKFYWLDHTKLLILIKKMDQNQLTHGAVRFMVVGVRKPEDFCKPNCARAVAFFHIHPLYHLTCVSYKCGNVSFFFISGSLSTDINHFVLSRQKKMTIFTFSENLSRKEYKKPPPPLPWKILPEDFDCLWH